MVRSRLSIASRVHGLTSDLNPGKTDRIDLATFYPALATFIDLNRLDGDSPLHPALQHQIINDVNPGVPPCTLPDGSKAVLLILGRKLEPDEDVYNTKIWNPPAQTMGTLSKLQRRICREGFVLPHVMSVCIALVAEMYTSNYDASSGERRTRLRYNSQPIADFGIVCGSVDARNQDKLAYLLPDGDILKGQDPHEHYWIYFKTIHGEDVFLECSMFTFNMCMCFRAGPYLGKDDDPIPFVPAFFRDRIIRKITSEVYHEKKRWSILRNEDVQNVVKDPSFHRDSRQTFRLTQVMDKIAGRATSMVEKNLLIMATSANCSRLAIIIDEQTWKKYPSSEQIVTNTVMEQDPEEWNTTRNITDEEREAKCRRSIREWKREHRKIRKNNDR